MNGFLDYRCGYCNTPMVRTGCEYTCPICRFHFAIEGGLPKFEKEELTEEVVSARINVMRTARIARIRSGAGGPREPALRKYDE